MIELNSVRKIKINLNDYDYKQDIANRIFIFSLNEFERKVLEEILYSSIKTPIHELADDLECELNKLRDTLIKLEKTNLFSLKDNLIIIDKSMRKYYEMQLAKFEDDFKPNYDYIKALLKNIPINVLPIWYAISKTSNNIFQSIFEKYLQTPKIYEKNLVDTKTKNSILHGIVEDVLKSNDKWLLGEEVKEKYNLTNEEFHENMLLLEYSFSMFLCYKNIKGKWVEIVSFSNEWEKYLTHRKETSPKEISDSRYILEYRPKPFGFVEDMTTFLNSLPQKIMKEDFIKNFHPIEDIDRGSIFYPGYIKTLYDKLVSFDFIMIKNNKLQKTDIADRWIKLSSKEKAITIYQNPAEFFPKNLLKIYNEKNIRKAEKSINRILNKKWVYLDDLVKSVMIPINEFDRIELIKEKGSWKYKIPQYNEVDVMLIKTTIEKWLFEVGAITLGNINNKKCIKITDFGKNLFEN